MSNILNHNRDVISIDIVKKNYWDFSLALNDSFKSVESKPIHKCLAVHIDTNIPECRNDLAERLVSNTVWENAETTDTTSLSNIGLTGLDNGLLYFDPTTMSNKDFIEIYSHSVLNIEEADRFYVSKVKSIYPEISLDATIIVDGEEEVAMLNGGFYQGFMYLPEHSYKVLPTELDKGWRIEFKLKPQDFDSDTNTLNSLHPENKGIFFYIGTRAENKWYYLYKTDLPNPIQKESYAIDYAEEYFGTDDGLNAPYISTATETLTIGIDSDYVENGYIETKDVKCEPYVESEYIKDDINIDPNYIPPTDDGFLAGQPNIKEIETDNKFITYNRSKDGRKVGDGKDDARYVLTDYLTKDEENYFILFNRNEKNRFDINNIEEYRKEHSRYYDVYADLYCNALGFQITDDGKIGYRYIVKDCENDGYKVESEYSLNDKIHKNQWNNVSINIKPVYKDKMRIQIYVGNRLVLVSKDLPVINLRKLDDIYTRQESVPFNISLGGGTTGLATAVYPDFRSRPNTVLPLESTFCGTFIGYMKEFRFFTCISD